MFYKIKMWIFSKLCLGASDNYINVPYPCGYCKECVNDTCQLAKKLGL